MATPSKSTRATLMTKLSTLVGVGKEFIASDVPTLRSVIQRGILIQERNIHNEIAYCFYSNKELSLELAQLVIDQWQKSNALFTGSVIYHRRSIAERIKKKWTELSNFAQEKGKRKGAKQIIDNELDKLFDILWCKCPITCCREANSNCEGCNLGAHISCKCPSESKIPTQDLLWVYCQRAKTGDMSELQMGSIDVKERRRQMKYVQRQVDEFGRVLKARKITEEEQPDIQISSDDISTGSSNKSNESNININMRRNILNVKHTAAASIRCNASNRTTATIVTAFLQDLIEGGFLSEDMNYLTCDNKKIQRAKEEIMSSAIISEESRILEDDVKGIFFDGKKDVTKVLKLNKESRKYYPAVIEEEHYTLTQEPLGRYLHHFTPDPSSKKAPAALQIASGVFEWIESHGVKETLMVIGGDSTNTITGPEGGAITHLEKLLNHKLHWSICMIHINELPLRHLISNLDGTTNSSVGYSGPIGKLLSKVNELSVNYNFKAMPGGMDLIYLPENIVKNLSTDQKNCYLLVNAIKNGDLSKELASYKCGPLCHSRWLTTAQGLLMLWTRNHGLQGKTLENFELIVKFVLQSYFKLYFDIKVKHRLADGPGHILTAITIYRNQSKAVQEAIKKTTIRGAYHSHSENVLLSLLVSEVQEDRMFAIDKILKLRKSNEFGSMSVRTHKNPELNFKATAISNLISWDECYEPVFTCNLSKEEIRSFKDSPMRAPDFPIHTQSTERAIQIVSKAAMNVYGQEKRDGYIRGMIDHRELFPVLQNKKTLIYK